MTDRTPEVEAFCQSFLASGAAPPDADARWHSAFSIGDGTSDHGADLVLSGRKTATSSRPEDFGPEGPPVPGSLSVLLGAGGRPRAVVETVAMHTVTLATADAALAEAYAEWDGGLAGFRQGMLAWYRSLDPDFDVKSPLLAEDLRVVWTQAMQGADGLSAPQRGELPTEQKKARAQGPGQSNREDAVR